MEITEPRRLYQQLAADLKERIEQGVYLVGDKLPAERFIADEKNVSRTVVREAIIMLEVEGYVEVRKGSGIHVVSNQPRHQQAADNNMEFANYGPFELLQARQLIESNIATYGLVNRPIIPGPIISTAPSVTTILRETIRFTPNQRWNSGGR